MNKTYRLIYQFINFTSIPTRPVRNMEGCNVIIVRFQASNRIHSLHIAILFSLGPPVLVKGIGSTT